MMLHQNAALHFHVCPVCAQEKLASYGERTLILSDPSIRAFLMKSHGMGVAGTEMVILSELLERRGEEISCWMCWDCKRTLE